METTVAASITATMTARTSSRFSSRRANGDFDPDTMTVGKYAVAPGVRVYEQFQDGAQVSVPLSSLDFGVIPKNQIRAIHKNSSGVVDVIVMNNVTGDAYMYGMMVAKVETTRTPITDDQGNVTGYEEDTKTTWSLVNRTKFDFNELAGYIGPHKGFAGIVADSKKLIISTLDLAEYQVTPADFFEQNGRYYVNAKGRTYQVADQVECYKTAVDSWFSEETGVERLRACIAFSSDLTVYVDPIGNKVRIVTAD